MKFAEIEYFINQTLAAESLIPASVRRGIFGFRKLNIDDCLFPFLFPVILVFNLKNNTLKNIFTCAKH